MILLILIMLATYIGGNIYWQKKIVEGKWIYLIYTTTILIIWFLFIWFYLV